MILPRAKLVEFENIEEGEGAFRPRISTDQAALLNKAVGTWHTHPGGSSNLSAGDAVTFRQWPNLQHAIVGEDGVSWYRVEEGAVLHD